MQAVFLMRMKTTITFTYPITSVGKFWIVCPVIIDQQRGLNDTDTLPAATTDSRQQSLFAINTNQDGGR